MRTLIIGAGAAALLAAAVATAPPAAAQIQGLEIVVPAAPGGGWDQTGRAMQNALQEAGLASGIQVVNIPGAGGTIGLAQFVSGKEGQGNALMTGGLVMLGAILTNQSPVTLEQVTPIARLTGEYEVIVVPASSEIQTLDDLIAQFKEDPQSVSWGGGSAGGTDHMLVGLIAKAVGVEPAGINYVPFAGGGEALASILGGHVTAGVSGYQEFAGQIETGDLRPLAHLLGRAPRGRRHPDPQGAGRRRRADQLARRVRAAGHLGRGQAGAGRRGRPDGRERDLAEHAQGARLARPLPAAGRVRRSSCEQDRQQVETVLKDIGLVQ